jgi:hypothetical protein
MGTTHHGFGLDEIPGIRDHAAKDANKNLDHLPVGRTPSVLEFQAAIQNLTGFEISIRSGVGEEGFEWTMIELNSLKNIGQRMPIHPQAEISIDPYRRESGGRYYTFEKGSNLELCLSILKEASRVAGPQCLFSTGGGNLVVFTEDSDFTAVTTEMGGPPVLLADPSLTGP